MYTHKNTNGYQRQHIETVIGAALWYIPNSKLWTGMISIAAVKSLHPDFGKKAPKLSEDHQYPRKVAARELLTRNWSDIPDPTSYIANRFVEEYGLYNYVTPSQNKKLMPHQRAEVFRTPQRAYELAGITLIKISDEQLRAIKSRDARVIDEVLGL